MNKKLVTLIIIILVSFCFLSIVVADNATHDDNSTSDHDATIDDDDSDDDDTSDDDKKEDKDKSSDKKNTHKNKTKDKSKKNYILAKGSGNGITFSDGFKGFILDYSKPSASSGDEYKRVSTSHASNSNTLKLAIVECYRHDSSGQIGKVVADFVKTGSSGSNIGKAVAASHEKVGDHAVVKINNHTEAVFDFEVLKSVSGNESDYFAYKVSFRTINDAPALNQTNNLTNVTNNTTNTTNVTNTTNITNITQPIDNQTNATFLKDLYDYLAFLANSLFDAWRPLIDTLINDFLMIVNALEQLAAMYYTFIGEIQSLIDAIGELLKMLEEIWNQLDGLLKLLTIILNAIQQLINLVMSILNFIMGLISALISLLQQLLDLLYSLIAFLMDLLNQIIALIQAIIDFLKSIGSALIKVIENAAIIIVAFVIITIGAFVYNRIR